MSLWVDKQRPTSLAKLSLHTQLTTKLQALGSSNDLPHLLFYGPPGAGKKTRVMALLREIYGAGVERVRLEHRTFKTPNNKAIDITTLGSNYHIECNPSDAGNNDKYIIQDVIKEIASHGTLQSAGQVKAFKVVVLTEVDKLTKQAQASLRRTMEKYSSHCRIILICNSSSKIIAPVRSRCLGIRVPSPSHEEIAEVLVTVAKKEQCPCPRELAMTISISSQRNLRRALLMLEGCKVQNCPLEPDQQVLLPDWEMYIIRLAREILSDQSPTKLLQARDMMYELLTNCIPATVIIETLTRELMKAMDDQLKHELIHWAAFYEHRLQTGSKEIFHLESFVCKIMSIYKRFIISMFG
ncbi:Rfc3 [Symbiodinium microadriaticum]|nr:Rfc3 [Symbiodinium microadriaticum]